MNQVKFFPTGYNCMDVTNTRLNNFTNDQKIELNSKLGPSKKLYPALI